MREYGARVSERLAAHEWGEKSRRKFLKLGGFQCVEGGMISGVRRVGFACWLIVVVVAFATALRGQEGTVNTRDTLVYKDGDRVHGRFVEQKGDTIVFKSDRFGELRVPAADAVVIKADKPAAPVVKEVVAAGIKNVKPEEREEEERVSIWERFSPAVLTAKVRNFFGPWHGRVAFSNEVVTDTAHRDNIALETRLQRKWQKDEVQMNGRYDYDQTNSVPTTDMIKGSGLWRHDFNRDVFSQYRPTLEWNRAGTREGVPNEYVLLQQEIGVGLNLWSTPSRKLRFGVSENLFDVWNSAPRADHSSRAVESLFDETELTLPWRMSVTQRAVWYPISNRHDGWEDRIELNKKLTETLSIAVRHEIRRNNPDGTAPDYTRLKLLFGLDF
jgi:hypothetical protein